MDFPKITVAIVAHNSGRIIGECIQSVITQEYPKDRYDIVVVDDSNDEDTIRICKQNGVRYIYAPEANSPGKGRNIALKNATGEIIAFIDTDCIAPRDWLIKIVKDFAENPDVVGVVGGFSGGKNWLQRLVNKEHVRNLKVKGYSTGFLEGNCAFKLNSLNGMKFGEHKYAEGIVLAKQLSAKGFFVLTDYDLRVIHKGFTHTLRKFFKMGRAHYHNTRSYFGDVLKSDLSALAVVFSLVLLLVGVLFKILVFAIPALLISGMFIVYALKWHSPVPLLKIVPSYLYFLIARWIFWFGYFREFVKPEKVG